MVWIYRDAFWRGRHIWMPSGEVEISGCRLVRSKFQDSDWLDGDIGMPSGEVEKSGCRLEVIPSIMDGSHSEELRRCLYFVKSL